MTLRVKDLMMAAIAAKYGPVRCKTPSFCPRQTRCPRHTHVITSCGNQSDPYCDPCTDSMENSMALLMAALHLVVTDKTIAAAKAESKSKQHKKKPARRR
jgi:hypothetical protein